jgi:hypothetical protein
LELLFGAAETGGIMRAWCCIKVQARIRFSLISLVLFFCLDILEPFPFSSAFSSRFISPIDSNQWPCTFSNCHGRTEVWISCNRPPPLGLGCTRPSRIVVPAISQSCFLAAHVPLISLAEEPYQSPCSHQSLVLRCPSGVPVRVQYAV